jgi:hypothetical protein
MVNLRFIYKGEYLRGIILVGFLFVLSTLALSNSNTAGEAQEFLPWTDNKSGIKFHYLGVSETFAMAKSLCASSDEGIVFPPRGHFYNGPLLFQWSPVEPLASAYSRFLESPLGSSLPWIRLGILPTHYQTFWVDNYNEIKMNNFNTIFKIRYLPARSQPGTHKEDYFLYDVEKTKVKKLPVVCISW